MRAKILLIVFGLVLAASACSAVEETMVSALFQSYISAQEALASDDADSAVDALKALANEASPEIKEVALSAADSGDLTEIRRKFKELSGQIEELELPEGYVVAYCPMADDGKGATWVQKDGDIKNPYFGKEMLSCGEVKKEGE